MNAQIPSKCIRSLLFPLLRDHLTPHHFSEALLASLLQLRFNFLIRSTHKTQTVSETVHALLIGIESKVGETTTSNHLECKLRRVLECCLLLLLFKACKEFLIVPSNRVRYKTIHIVFTSALRVIVAKTRTDHTTSSLVRTLVEIRLINIHSISCRHRQILECLALDRILCRAVVGLSISTYKDALCKRRGLIAATLFKGCPRNPHYTLRRQYYFFPKKRWSNKARPSKGASTGGLGCGARRRTITSSSDSSSS